MLHISVGYSSYHLWDRKNGHFNEKFTMLYGGLFGVSLLGNVIHALRGAALGKPENDGLHVHGKLRVCTGAHGQSPDWMATTMGIDFAVQMMIGTVYYAFPTPIMKMLVISVQKFVRKCI